jgi:hypothetical protein
VLVAVQLVNRFAPLMIGAVVVAVPYAPKVIEPLALPDDGTVNCSLHVHPLWNKMESPGLKVEALTFATVSQGVEELVPLLVSLPVTTQLST